MNKKISKITEAEFLEFQLNISQLKSTSDQKYCSMVGKGFCPYEYEDGKCKVECKCVNHITK